MVKWSMVVVQCSFITLALIPVYKAKDRERKKEVERDSLRAKTPEKITCVYMSAWRSRRRQVRCGFNMAADFGGKFESSTTLAQSNISIELNEKNCLSFKCSRLYF
jgi:hypothetical protein